MVTEATCSRPQLTSRVLTGKSLSVCIRGPWLPSQLALLFSGLSQALWGDPRGPPYAAAFRPPSPPPDPGDPRIQPRIRPHTPPVQSRKQGRTWSGRLPLSHFRGRSGDKLGECCPLPVSNRGVCKERLGVSVRGPPLPGLSQARLRRTHVLYTSSSLPQLPSAQQLRQASLLILHNKEFLWG